MNVEDIFYSLLIQKPLITELKNSSDQTIFESLDSLGIASNVNLVTVIEELVYNAREHAKINIKVYISKIFDSLYFAITDNGPGIHNTIPCNKNLSDLKGKSSAAIMRTSCEEGISGTGVVGRGVGLYLLSEQCSLVSGEILIACNGYVLIQRQSIFMQKKLNSEIDGTIICFRFPI
ncbi:MAG: ATP-binding protein [Oligoflexia bacterium]|nr:ATP-binding protein [Oligoflexia bacterium]